jgi:hypothetical protein
MNCERCGEVCHCPEQAGVVQEESITAGGLGNTPANPATAQPGRMAETNGSLTGSPSSNSGQDGEDSAWRDELAARLKRYRARRKIRPPRYPSTRLPFDSFENSRNDSPARPDVQPMSKHALALNGVSSHPALPEAAAAVPLAPTLPAPNVGAKIIEFPRFAWTPPPPPSDQLAEPVSERPRILEVPETEPPPPALGGITIEPSQAVIEERRPGIDFPLQSAPLLRRVAAGLVDGFMVGLAAALFALIFWKITRLRPPLPQILGLAAAVSGALWAIYQYLLIVYGGSTAGLLASGLVLARFDGSSTNRSARRWRVLASYLSAVSLGMGYAWLFLDEDTLCWHDRITHTYLAPKHRDCGIRNPVP